MGLNHVRIICQYTYKCCSHFRSPSPTLHSKALSIKFRIAWCPWSRWGLSILHCTVSVFFFKAHTLALFIQMKYTKVYSSVLSFWKWRSQPSRSVCHCTLRMKTLNLLFLDLLRWVNKYLDWYIACLDHLYLLLCAFSMKVFSTTHSL